MTTSSRDSRCPMCGAPRLRAGRIRTSITFDVPKLGRGSTSAMIPTIECRECPYEAEDRSSFGIRAAAVAHALGILSSAEIRSARRALGWSRKELAERTGIGTASIFRWETGRVFQTRSNDRLLRLALGLTPGRTAVGRRTSGASPGTRPRPRAA